MQNHISFSPFRLYSSTGFFSLPPQSNSNDWFELGEESWEEFENQVMVRLESMKATGVAGVGGLGGVGDVGKNTTKLRRKSPAASLNTALQEVALLNSWDQPIIHSPVKEPQKEEIILGNSIVVFTQLPICGLQELQTWLGKPSGGMWPTSTELGNTFLSAPVKSKFDEDCISLHLVNTVYEQEEQITAKELFWKSLKKVRGGMLPLSSLISHSGSGSQLVSNLPVSSKLTSYLAEVKRSIGQRVKSVRNSSFTLQLESQKIELEFSEGPVLPPNLQLAGLTSTSSFPFHSKVAVRCNNEVTLWARMKSEKTFLSLLTFLQLSGQCAVLAGPTGLLHVLTPLTKSTARLFILDRVDSHYYNRVLAISETGSALHLDSSSIINLLAGSVHKPEVGTTTPFTPSGCLTPNLLDSSCLEKWRVPDTPETKVMTSLEAATAALAKQKIKNEARLTAVREEYLKKQVPKQVLGSGHEGGGVGQGVESQNVKTEILKKSFRQTMKDKVKLKEDFKNQILQEGTVEEGIKKVQDSVSNDVLHLVAMNAAKVDILLQNSCGRQIDEELRRMDLIKNIQEVKLDKNREIEHKHQVILRVEMHWILSSKEKQTEIQKEILDNLRSLATLKSNSEMVNWLETVSKFYLGEETSELFENLFEELAIFKTKELERLFPDPPSPPLVSTDILLMPPPLPPKPKRILANDTTKNKLKAPKQILLKEKKTRKQKICHTNGKMETKKGKISDKNNLKVLCPETPVKAKNLTRFSGQVIPETPEKEGESLEDLDIFNPTLKPSFYPTRSPPLPRCVLRYEQNKKL